ncbi:oxalate-binding protein [Anaeramoeba ignava]|uniref:Oxalate-binding protein n=1 Tax=Anaeramoeba ignava TaxID=1746090 RepID=A0A9Q0LP93_ANAIG|nr:oxalate-binding protein [Anaeramoeba ignava]|eukprot:Anaeramoba_ignava/a486493_36.p1 GENE.a486493_36~~a486493_36.p1  ORF type:complete len:263 (+),score=69.70 a486493_36:9-797(+)
MKLVFFFSFLFILTFFKINSLNQCSLGEFTGKAKNILFDDLVNSPEILQGQFVSFKASTGGKGSSTWLQLKKPNSELFGRNFQGINYTFAVGNVVITSQDKAFSFPTDIRSDVDVYLEGTVSNISIILPQLSPLTLIQVEVSAINFTSESQSLCQSWSNQPITQDLHKGDIHGDNVGGGLVCLDPGKTEPLHTTYHSTEVITGISGDVWLGLERGVGTYQYIHITSFFSALVPPATPHYVINNSTQQSCYIFVHSIVDSTFD